MNLNRNTDQMSWRPEVELRLRSLNIYKEFQKRSKYDSYFSNLNANLIDHCAFSYQRSKLIIKHLPQFTLHDGDHIFRVIEIMGKLIPDNVIKKLSIVDLYALMISAFFHDIGLAPTDREVSAWRSALSKDFTPKSTTKDSITNFISRRPAAKISIIDAMQKGEYERLSEIEDNIITDFIRETHGSRLINVIDRMGEAPFLYRDLNLTPYISKICQSHVEDAMSIRQMNSIVPCGEDIYFSPQFVAAVLRIADLIDFDMKRAPDALFAAMRISNPISINEWNKHRSISSWTIKPDILSVSAECSHPIIESSLHSFCDQIDIELAKTNAILKIMNDSVYNVHEIYRNQFPKKVERAHIRAKTNNRGEPIYKNYNTKFSLDQEKIIELLMGTSLYGNPKVALRELLQNSFDACLVRQALARSWGDSFKPKLSVILRRKADVHELIIEDNGIGMDEQIINAFYAKVGTSYYKSAEFYEFLAENRINYAPISRFGIGVLSYFLVANRINVLSRRLIARGQLGTAVKVTVDGINRLFWVTGGEAEDAGTSTTLTLLPNHPWSRLTADDVIASLEDIVPEPQFEIEIDVDGNKKIYVGRDQDERKNERKKKSEESFRDTRKFIREETIRCIDQSQGYELDVNVFWIEHKKQPWQKYQMSDSHVIDPKNSNRIPIKSYIAATANKITRWSTSIWTDERGISSDGESYYHFIESDLSLSVHGFSVPFEPFKDERRGVRIECSMELPFAVIGRVMVRTPADLNLSAARDGVIVDEKWMELKIWIYKSILSELEKKLSKKYFGGLIEAITVITMDTEAREIIRAFERGLSK